MPIVHTDYVIHRRESKLRSITIMDLFCGTFEYLPAHRIAICRTYQQGIIKSQLQTHLTNMIRRDSPNQYEARVIP